MYYRHACVCTHTGTQVWAHRCIGIQLYGDIRGYLALDVDIDIDIDIAIDTVVDICVGIATAIDIAIYVYR